VAWNWTGDESRWTEQQKLASLEPEFRSHVLQLLEYLKQKGWQPRVIFGWRSPATQLRLKKLGRSQVIFGYHNVVGSDGQPAALAADIVDARYGWGGKEVASDPKTQRAAAFFQDMGAWVKAKGLHWGGNFSQTNVWKHWGMGWDPAHVQRHGHGVERYKAFALTAMESPGAGAMALWAKAKKEMTLAPWWAWVVGASVFVVLALLLKRRRGSSGRTIVMEGD